MRRRDSIALEAASPTVATATSSNLRLTYVREGKQYALVARGDTLGVFKVQ